jgi:hydroxyproline O-arabinosyltransferase
MRTMYPQALGPLQSIPNTGPAPVLMRAAEWLRVAPDWERLTAQIEAAPEAKAKLGWVREMYAFSIAWALQVRRTTFLCC